MGVSYRLLAMFMLAPELDGATTRGALWLGAAALTVAILGGVALIWSGMGPNWALAAAGLLALGALALYGRDIARLYRERKRRVIELNSRMAAVALAHLAVAVLVGAVLAVTGTLGRYVGPLLFLVAFGWLGGLGLAKLYKIVAFLTWLECYGPVLGRVAAPRVQDLVVEPRALRWFAIYFAAVDDTALALLADVSAIARIELAAMLIATIAVAAELVRIRRLVDVQRAARLPEGAHQPRLLVSMVEKG
jgi:dipeptide/tripeptide permease